ncbi:MAG: AAA domain-containing protein [Alkalispirochaeta sp.]
MTDTNDPKQWLRYYRNSLVDSERTADPRKNDSDNNNSIILNSIADLNGDRAVRFLSKIVSEEDGVEPLSEVSVQIAPIYFSPETSHGKKAGTGDFYPFWIPARLCSDGTLLPPEATNELPWFIRQALSPSGENEGMPVLGTSESYDAAMDSIKIENGSWEEYRLSAERVFKHVVGKTFSETTVESYVRRDVVTVTAAGQRGISDAIVALYDAYRRKGKTIPRLASSLVTQTDETEEREHADDATIFLNEQHVGQMGNLFPLSDSQRRAFAAHTSTRQGETLAIHGPPGTGKTTLLQTVVANMVVSAAHNGDEPPLILASSTNNQAITNILDSFASTQGTTSLERRWISTVKALGTYMASSRKAEEWAESGRDAPVLTILRGKIDGDYFSNLLGLNIDTETVHFLRKLTEIFPEAQESVTNVEEAAAYLHARIAEEVDLIRQCVRSSKILADGFEIGADPFATLAARYCELEINLKRAEEAQDLADTAREKLLTYYDNESPIRRIFSFVPRIRTQRIEEIRLRLGPNVPSHFFDNVKHPSQVTKKLNGLMATAGKNVATAKGNRDHFKTTTVPLQLLQERWERYLFDSQPDKDAGQKIRFVPPWYVTIAAALDVTARNRAFLLALHFWEARWLHVVQSRTNEFSNGAMGRQSLFRELAHLTPLFVATCHSIPRFMTVYRRGRDEGWESVPLGDVFDLLIVDEAGQVAPEVGIAPFMFAKRALVVGDVHQIQPIWGTTSRYTDEANLSMLGLAAEGEWLSRLQKLKVLASNGSLMHLAQRISPYRIPSDLPVRGAFLSEHRRSVDEIINYSNTYVYDGRLIPLAGSLAGMRKHRQQNNLPINSLPAVGYINVRGNASRHKGSRRNQAEARAIARFLAVYSEELTASYDGKPLSEIVGIVTPFRAQREEIRSALEREGIDASSLVVGTVHALQGAERPVVVFSPTYGSNERGISTFFDADFNMLNVAVSRAKHHFIVIGEMSFFNPACDWLPSGALAQILFADPQNEIGAAFVYEKATEFESSDEQDIHGVSRLSTSVQHVRALKRAFEVATERLVIVSPFISITAIEADGLIPLIRSTTKREVEVTVYTDRFLDRERGQLKKRSERGRRAIEEAGGIVIERDGIHNKAVAIDRVVLIEGSFNWLSAQRDKNHRFFRNDVSVVVKNDRTEQFIEDLMHELSSGSSG